jgi:hypothetical protein
LDNPPAGGNQLPIYRLLQTEAFDPDTVEMLGECFEGILRELKLTVRTDPAALLVAQRIIEFANWGERDRARLQERVLTSLEVR